ncbi:MAG: MerR family transcriptional regulator [Oscillospiraceae bacterium]
MKINEVESLVGVTRRNIRFYENEGLLTPARNKQNGYREYGEAEVEELKKIKLLRKLGVPLDEIRRMQAGPGTVADGMCRHLITLEREKQDLEQAMVLCHQMKDQDVRLSELDAETWLKEMEDLERKGTTFQNKQRGDVNVRRYAPPAVAAVVMIALMAGVIALMVWAFTIDPEAMPPVALMVALVAIPVVVILGIVLALAQRWREIHRGEEDEARKY